MQTILNYADNGKLCEIEYLFNDLNVTVDMYIIISAFTCMYKRSFRSNQIFINFI